MAAGDYQGTYDPSKVIITVGSVIVSGFGDGDFISVKFDESRSTKKIGADGEVGRSRNPSKAGTAEITLSSSSKANDELSAIFNLAQVGGFDAPVAFGIADLSGRTLATASKAWLKDAPDVSYGKEIGERTWTLDLADLSLFIGGNS